VRVRVYVDGFNLYYRALSNTPYRWLDLSSFARHVLSDHEVVAIRYFTAKVSGVSDPQSPIRQQTYLRALRTIENLSIHFGSFQRTKDWQRLVGAFPDTTTLPPPPAPQVRVKNGQQRIKVHKSNEKGSDVNLASFLLLDTVRKADLGFDAVAVVTNDSDLVTPITMVRDELATDVLVLDPQIDPRNAGADAKELKNAATSYRKIRVGSYAASQFPTNLRDPNGTITKPRYWWREAQRDIVLRLMELAGALTRCPHHPAEQLVVADNVSAARAIAGEQFRAATHGDAFASEGEIAHSIAAVVSERGERCRHCSPD
jgi:hypothetical protein